MDLFQTKAIITGGRMEMVNRSTLQEFISKIQGPMEVFVVIREVDKARSRNANNLWHSIVQRLAQATGLSFDETRTFLKIRHGVSYPYNQSFSPAIVAERPGAFVQYGGEYLYLVSTANYTKKEFTVLIEGTLRDCAEENVFTGDIT